MRLGRREASCLQDRSNQLIIKSQHLIQQFTILNMVAFLVTVELHRVRHHLFLRYVFEHEEVRVVFIVVIIGAGRASLIIEKALTAGVRPAH